MKQDKLVEWASGFAEEYRVEHNGIFPPRDELRAAAQGQFGDRVTVRMVDEAHDALKPQGLKRGRRPSKPI